MTQSQEDNRRGSNHSNIPGFNHATVKTKDWNVVPYFEGRDSLNVEGVSLYENKEYVTTFKNFEIDDFIVHNSVGSIGYQFIKRGANYDDSSEAGLVTQE